MKMKSIAACIGGLSLLATAAIADPAAKGVINTIDVDAGRISINYDDLMLDENVEVSHVDGNSGDASTLSPRQRVRYTLNRYGKVNSISVYDPHKLKEQGYYSGNDLNH